MMEIQDVFGNKIKLTEERWQHIISGHPIMKKKLSRIVATLKAPDVIVKVGGKKTSGFIISSFKNRLASS